jgi:hypothetical protein
MGYWKGDYDRLSVLIPFVDRYPQAKYYLNLRNDYQNIKLLSKCYQFNSVLYNLIIYNIFYSKFKHVCSFIPNNDMVLKDSIAHDNELNNFYSSDLDSNKLTSLLELVKLSKLHGFKLIFINSPIYNNKCMQNKYSKAGINTIKILNKYKVDFFDFTDDSFFFNKNYLFANRTHLNGKGAEIFSKLISEKIHKFLK